MLTLLVTFCLSVDPAETGMMRGNLTALFVLQPYLASPSKFRDPASSDVILSSLDQLAVLQHQLVEPTPREISGLFAERVKEARNDFAHGQRDAARLRLSGLTNLCLGCHTRAPAQVEPSYLSAERLSLTPPQKAHFLAAVRQFDAALAQWKAVLAQPPANELEAYDQVLALRSAIGVATRAKDDPQQVLELLALVRDRPGLSGFTRRALAEWAKQAAAWKAERFSATTERAPALYARAKALVEATPAFGSVAADEEHFVVLQRATSYLNRALELEPGARWAGEALYLLAIASSAALDPELWQLDELYLEACVREVPHSKLAVKCVDRLADRTLYQYTLDGQTQVPLERASRIGDLRALAR